MGVPRFPPASDGGGPLRDLDLHNNTVDHAKRNDKLVIAQFMLLCDCVIVWLRLVSQSSSLCTTREHSIVAAVPTIKNMHHPSALRSPPA